MQKARPSRRYQDDSRVVCSALHLRPCACIPAQSETLTRFNISGFPSNYLMRGQHMVSVHACLGAVRHVTVTLCQLSGKYSNHQMCGQQIVSMHACSAAVHPVSLCNLSGIHVMCGHHTVSVHACTGVARSAILFKHCDKGPNDLCSTVRSCTYMFGASVLVWPLCF